MQEFPYQLSVFYVSEITRENVYIKQQLWDVIILLKVLLNFALASYGRKQKREQVQNSKYCSQIAQKRCEN